MSDLVFKDAGGGRGLIRADFVDASGEACSLQSSSLATEPAIWFGCNSGVHHMGECLARIHLTQEHVRRLLPTLQRFAETGELVELEGAGGG